MAGRHEDTEVMEGSSNVFADVSASEPEEELTKAQLARHIRGAIKRRRLTQTAAAGLMGKDAQDEFIPPLRGLVPQMRADKVVAPGNKGLMRALAAPDLWLLTNTSNPLVAAGRRVSHPPRFGIFPAAGKDVIATAEKAPKEVYLLASRTGRGDRRGRQAPSLIAIFDWWRLQTRQELRYGRALGIERGQPVPQLVNLARRLHLRRNPLPPIIFPSGP